MSEKKVIDAKIDAATRRRKLQWGWQNMWLGLLIGVCLWLASLSVYKLAPVPQTTLLWAGVIGLALPLAGLLIGLAKRFAGSDTARWLDREIGLKERLSTAVEMSDISAKNSAWSALVISDAAKAAGKIEPGKLLPLRLPKVCHWTLLVLAACVGLGFVPEHRSQAHLDHQRDSAIIEDVGQNLTALTKLQVKLSPPHFEPTEDALESVQELGREFKRGKLVRDEALAKLSSLAERLRDQSSKLSHARTLKKMQQAARTTPAAGSQTKAEMRRQLDELKKSLGNAKEAKQEQFDALKSKMDDVKDAAAGLPDPSSPEGQQARLELAQSMADLARMAEQMGLEMPNIDEALQALESSDIDQFLKNIDFAGEDLQKMENLAKAMQNLQMQMAEIGKTLGQQLENGQVPAAIESLQKMIEQLASAQLTPEQLEKMIQELQEALGPAEDFGECSKCLSDAKGKAKVGDKAGASQSLAEAAEELKKVLQQLGDMENMMASLQNLERAQLAVGNCQSFGSCQKPGVGPSSKPGGGVGTWGDDSYQLTPEDLAQRWDNSGFSRPGMDARGNTDRGPGKVPDDMVSTRIKGKINPKGSMPSFTLRGVSIKGSSKVQFQEAVTAAQSDARNALNQDKVPRAYRDSVRDYFDDLKE
jgi:tetratricopeptide (TPR) repeat protein